MISRLNRACVAVAAAAALLGACAPGPNATSAAGERGTTRTVQHAKGTAEVPANPQRVVVLDTGELDDTLALGVKPVGAVRVDVATDYLAYLGDQTAGIEMVGTISEPNLEKIAALNPDLILSSTVRHEELYEELNEIAPTVLAPDLGDTWKDNFLLYAEALGKTEQAKQMVADFERRAAAVGDTIGEGKSVSIVRFLPGEIRLYSDKSFIGTVITDMGLKVPEAARGADTFAALSAEQITKANADYIYVSTYGPATNTDRVKVVGGPLWSRLSAVQQDRMYDLDDDIISGIGIQAAEQLLHRFESNLR
jgi:iron complex transport system substrate-binding protein